MISWIHWNCIAWVAWSLWLGRNDWKGRPHLCTLYIEILPCRDIWLETFGNCWIWFLSVLQRSVAVAPQRESHGWSFSRSARMGSRSYCRIVDAIFAFIFLLEWLLRVVPRQIGGVTGTVRDLSQPLSVWTHYAVYVIYSSTLLE